MWISNSICRFRSYSSSAFVGIVILVGFQMFRYFFISNLLLKAALKKCFNLHSIQAFNYVLQFLYQKNDWTGRRSVDLKSEEFTIWTFETVENGVTVNMVCKR